MIDVKKSSISAEKALDDISIVGEDRTTKGE